jgi:hypothetical protein
MYACLFMVVQGILWATLGRWDPAFDSFIFLYYPTIAIVERFGNYTGEANIIEPIMIGVPLGIACYSVILAVVLTFLKNSKAK